MKLGELVARIIENAPRADQLPRDPIAIYEATRKLAAFWHWETRPTPFYTREFYLKRGRDFTPAPGTDLR